MIRRLLSVFRTPDPRFDVWARIPLFRSLSRRELAEIERLLQSKKVEKGETLFSQGQPGSGVFVVLTGAVEIRQDEDDGTTLRLSQVTEGGFFGELALLDESPRTATAVTTEPTELVALYRADLLKLSDRNPKLGVKVLMELSQIVAERLRQTNRSLKDVRLEAAALGEPEGET